MEGAKVTFSGLDELQQALIREASLEDKKEAVREHGSALQKRAQRNAVFRGHYEGRGKKRKFVNPTGNLRRSIQPPRIGAGGLEATVEVTAEYSGYVEVGTRYMEAQPFMKPAYEETVEKFVEDLGKAGS